eukprot:NODE_1285_length_1023_cov_56.040041_g986_i0.p1 GENE.NODE_1285_length_1023_cov_56.040041_g986_i0~~NODE_1285_length_1023_cov_56.040041_g986_i0.p1  ORF type:complete len:198 (+),score=71.61 NODE_1285_length_1023_cov_56.040041_g986_i0:53-646(+)
MQASSASSSASSSSSSSPLSSSSSTSIPTNPPSHSQGGEDFSVEGVATKLNALKTMFDSDICEPLIEKARQVVKEKEEFEAEKAKHRDPDARMDDIIKLDIGGKFVDIVRSDLCSVPESKLAKIFNGDFQIAITARTGRTFLDRDYTFWHIIQAYLEGKPYAVPTESLDVKRLCYECDYYGLGKLKEEVELGLKSKQ